MLAGPSEGLVIADESADPEVVAADLLAQAEHDVEARPFLVTAHASVVDAGSPHPPNHWRVPGYVPRSNLRASATGKVEPCHAIVAQEVAR